MKLFTYILTLLIPITLGCTSWSDNILDLHIDIDSCNGHQNFSHIHLRPIVDETVNYTSWVNFSLSLKGLDYFNKQIINTTVDRVDGITQINSTCIELNLWSNVWGSVSMVLNVIENDEDKRDYNEIIFHNYIQIQVKIDSSPENTWPFVTVIYENNYKEWLYHLHVSDLELEFETDWLRFSDWYHLYYPFYNVSGDLIHRFEVQPALSCDHNYCGSNRMYICSKQEHANFQDICRCPCTDDNNLGWETTDNTNPGWGTTDDNTITLDGTLGGEPSPTEQLTKESNKSNNGSNNIGWIIFLTMVVGIQFALGVYFYIQKYKPLKKDMPIEFKDVE